MSSTLDTGEVISIVGDQVVVRSAPKPPGIGSTVYNERGGAAGTVSDIIGPVEKPYIVVKAKPNVTLKPGDSIRSN
ncbi:MAG: H/ACA RNA-protein complex protein Gar1 [Candidatus Altiarchaeota archaeon]